MTDLASKSDLAMLAVLAGAVAVVGLVGSAVTIPAIPGWYAALEKPWFTPPNAAFGPVWATLYALMAYAGWRAWRAAAGGQVRQVLAVFALQLTLNAAWSQLFFGWRRPDLALIDVALLWAAIAWSIRIFARHDRWAAGLMLPYLAWVSLAVALNAGVVVLN
jgi:tryptophan-rich sensory protein